ncbi:MAG: thymidine kinase [Cryomorphaceae bacterium]|nr:thymidine kinase [Cryomorphaceae bacterium]
MFQEHAPRFGHIEVIAGSMFSGKTEELIRRLKRAQIAQLKVLIVKPITDNRYADNEVVTHDHGRMNALAVASAREIMALASESDVVGIDEAQFFDMDIVAVANELANAGKRVVLAGLDMDFHGEPFGPMPNLMAVAEFVTKVHAVCVRSGELANYSHRLIADPNQVMLGDRRTYEPLSRAEFVRERRSTK